MRTFTPKADEVTRQWHVIDAQDVVLGRLATHAATLLRGKHKPTFAPHVDTGDFVIVINAEKVALSGAKAEQKLDHRHSGFPGGLKSTTYDHEEVTNSEGIKQIVYKPSTALRYDFSVVRDDNPLGDSWLRSTLAERG